MKRMKEYQKPEIAMLSFLSMEAISAENFSDWLASQPDFSDAPVSAYSDTSLGL